MSNSEGARIPNQVTGCQPGPSMGTRVELVVAGYKEVVCSTALTLTPTLALWGEGGGGGGVAWGRGYPTSTLTLTLTKDYLQLPCTQVFEFSTYSVSSPPPHSMVGMCLTPYLTSMAPAPSSEKIPPSRRRSSWNSR